MSGGEEEGEKFPEDGEEVKGADGGGQVDLGGLFPVYAQRYPCSGGEEDVLERLPGADRAPGREVTVEVDEEADGAVFVGEDNGGFLERAVLGTRGRF